LGRVALVTGASRGIGEATAKLLAMNGAKVVVHYFRGRQSAQEIVEDIRSEGGVAIACGADLGAEAEILNMFGEAEAALGGIDILVNNAVAEFSPQPFEELSASDYLRELDVSLFGTHACCKRALLHMRSQRWGKMINVGSVATELPPSGQNKYITVKSALAGYTRSLASELARDNIQVNMVVPRMTETSLLAALPPALLTKLAEESVTGRLLQPVEVAKAILFLASDWAGAISGQRLVLNHGEPPFL
jgi:NAD(P)-dependent dehydrogenase (short-subunit alcohol dehydrogenase family)